MRDSKVAGRIAAGAGVVVVCVAAAVMALGAAPAAWGASASTAEIVQPGTTTALSSGGSATQFGVLLPNNAHCPGDSTKPPFYEAGSYMVLKGTNPAAVSFRGLFPVPGLFLVAFGAAWEHQNVEKGTGDVLLPEYFNIARFQTSDVLPGGVKSAVWDVGVVCENQHGVVSNYWNVGVTVTASSTDPAGWVWKADPSDLSSKTSPWPALIGLVVVVVAAALLVLAIRGRSEPASGARPRVTAGTK
jgi:hypothetical protein